MERAYSCAARQDVQELLAAGIGVMTAVYIQHVETLNRAGARIAGRLGDNAMQIIRGLSSMCIQHEAIEAQKAMLGSPNHTVVYIPVGPMGVPITGKLPTVPASITAEAPAR